MCIRDSHLNIFSYILPIIALIVIAFQMVVVKTDGLSKLRGGGFGMYSVVSFTLNEVWVNNTDYSLDSLTQNNRDVRLAVKKLKLIPSQKNLKQTAELLFDEAFSERYGRLPMIDSLTNIFLIHVFRHVLNNNMMQHGLLAGLAHPQVSKVLLAIHDSPERQWGLEEMAELALMSRSKFSELFKRIVGQSPGDYIIDWRIIVAKSLLQQNKPVALVANAVGYETVSYTHLTLPTIYSV